MIISKAIELLSYSSLNNTILLSIDDKDALKLGIEALKRIQYARQHPFTKTISPLPGETMPDRGVQAGLQSRQAKKTKRA